MVLFRIMKRDTVYVLAENEEAAAKLMPEGAKIIKVLPVKNTPKDINAPVINAENKVMVVSDCSGMLSARSPSKD